MAGETIKSGAICLRIIPWSQTSHVTQWLTPSGRIATVVKGAVRPKSAFLGQYDLNYTCEIIYYARAKGELHALRECVPVNLRENLRSDFRALTLADYYRGIVSDLAPSGPESEAWFDLLARSLDILADAEAVRSTSLLARLLEFELQVLNLAGLSPELEAESGSFTLRGERQIPVSSAVARCLLIPVSERNPEILLDAARVIGVFYSYHMDSGLDVRRSVLKLIS